jgi:hypothetical protein
MNRVSRGSMARTAVRKSDPPTASRTGRYMRYLASLRGICQWSYQSNALTIMVIYATVQSFRE